MKYTVFSLLGAGIAATVSATPSPSDLGQITILAADDLRSRLAGALLKI